MNEKCFYCGEVATHFCYGCGHWLCNSAHCNARAAGEAARKAGAAFGSTVKAAISVTQRALGIKP
jgi:hypothetical protein